MNHGPFLFHSTGYPLATGATAQATGNDVDMLLIIKPCNGSNGSNGTIGIRQTFVYFMAGKHENAIRVVIVPLLPLHPPAVWVCPVAPAVAYVAYVAPHV